MSMFLWKFPKYLDSNTMEIIDLPNEPRETKKYGRNHKKFATSTWDIP